MMWFIWQLFSQVLQTCLQDQWAQVISEVQGVVYSPHLKEVEVKLLEQLME